MGKPIDALQYFPLKGGSNVSSLTRVHNLKLPSQFIFASRTPGGNFAIESNT